MRGRPAYAPTASWCSATCCRSSPSVWWLKLGNGFAPGTTIGPLINEAAADKVERHLDDATARGGRLLYRASSTAGERFTAPAVVVDATTDMQLASEETFGPLAPLFAFDTEEEAVDLANASESGLAGYFYSRDVGRIWRVARALETGMIGANTGMLSMEVAPFGGIKQSGFGREGSLLGMAEYMHVKTLHLDVS